MDFNIGDPVQWLVGSELIEGCFRGEGAKPGFYSVRTQLSKGKSSYILDVQKEILKIGKI